MWSVLVVVAQPGAQRSRAAFRGDVGLRVGPFAEQRLDEAFGLAVRPWGVRPRSQMPEPELAAGTREDLGDIAAPVVGHHPPHPDPAFRVPGDRALQKALGSDPLLVIEYLDVGEAGGVIDAT